MSRAVYRHKWYKPRSRLRRFLTKGIRLVDVGLATETDTAFPIGKKKDKAIGLAGETDTAFALTAQKSRTLGLATETDTAFSIGKTKSKTLGLAIENDEALAITVEMEGIVTLLPLIHAGK